MFKLFWQEILDLVTIDEEAEILLMGDFNATFDKDLDRSQQSTALEVPKVLIEFIENFHMVDIWRRDIPEARKTIPFSPIDIRLPLG